MARRHRGAALLTTCCIALFLIAPAFADHEDTWAGVDLTYPSIDALASHWARRPVHVECASSWDTWNADTDAQGSYGYTWLDTDWTRVQPGICEDALSAGHLGFDGKDPWRVAIAVHVITHESWHLRDWFWRGDEAHVECQAVKHDVKSFQLLGASDRQAEELYSWAYYFHIREGDLFPAYHQPYCRERKP